MTQAVLDTLADIDRQIEKLNGLRKGLEEFFQVNCRLESTALAPAPIKTRRKTSAAPVEAAAWNGKVSKRDKIRLVIREFEDVVEFSTDAVCKAVPQIARKEVMTILSQLARAGELLTVAHEDARRGYRKNLAFGK